MATTSYYYFYGDPIIMRDSGYHDNRFWITCKITFIYLMEKINFDYRILHVINGAVTKYKDPEVNTYYIECEEEDLEKLLNKYCEKDACSSLMSDWDLYGSEYGTVQKRLHVLQFDDGDILFSRSEESNDWFYLSAPDHFWKTMDSRYHYKELEMREDDRFKNRDNFKLIEINEYEMVNIFSSIVDRKNVEEKMKQLFEECKQWTETQ